MNGRTLVTGATGHLGANLVRRLIADGEWVRVLLRPDKATSAVDGLDVERVVGDVRDADMVAVSCAILGPNDFVPSRMGGVLRSFARGELSAYIPGGFPWVAARDIVEGHVLAMNKGRSGERYIFATEYRTMDEILGAFET